MSVDTRNPRNSSGEGCTSCTSKVPLKLLLFGLPLAVAILSAVAPLYTVKLYAGEADDMMGNPTNSEVFELAVGAFQYEKLSQSMTLDKSNPLEDTDVLLCAAKRLGGEDAVENGCNNRAMCSLQEYKNMLCPFFCAQCARPTFTALTSKVEGSVKETRSCSKDRCVACVRSLSFLFTLFNFASYLSVSASLVLSNPSFLLCFQGRGGGWGGWSIAYF